MDEGDDNGEDAQVSADILTAQQLAKRLGWGMSTIYRTPLPMLRKGRRGRSYYWPDVLAYLRRSGAPDNPAVHSRRRVR